MLIADVIKIVVVGILRQASIEEGPCENILENGLDKNHVTIDTTYNRVLLVLDRLLRDLRQEEVVKKMRGQVRLDGQSLVQELAIKVFPILLAHQDASAPVIYRRAAGMPHHL